MASSPQPLLLLALIWLAAAAPDPTATVLGQWMTEDLRGVIRIEPCGDAFCGRVVGISDFPPGGLRDNHGKPQCQLVIIHDLKPADSNRRLGTITNPDDGKTYDALVWVPADGDLRLRGYVGIAMLGSTQHWPKFRGTVDAACHMTPARAAQSTAGPLK